MKFLALMGLAVITHCASAAHERVDSEASESRTRSDEPDVHVEQEQANRGCMVRYLNECECVPSRCRCVCFYNACNDGCVAGSVMVGGAACGYGLAYLLGCLNPLDPCCLLASPGLCLATGGYATVAACYCCNQRGRNRPNHEQDVAQARVQGYVQLLNEREALLPRPDEADLPVPSAPSTPTANQPLPVEAEGSPADSERLPRPDVPVPSAPPTPTANQPLRVEAAGTPADPLPLADRLVKEAQRLR